MIDYSEVIVAIHCTVYNHEPYIRECLEGFVMQKTNFRFVAIVHDDASTDKTADIIREYEAKYPEIIKPIYETENQYSKHDGSLDRIMNAAIDATGAKYVALCEGDDYWTDPYKLQKQVDFLEAHEDYVLCSHKTAVKNESNRNVLFLGDSLPEGEIFPKDIFPKWTIHLSSMVYRKSAIENFHLKHSEWLESGDTVLALKCMHRGRAWAFPETMSTYRMNDFSAMSKPNDQKAIEKYCRHLKCLLLNFPKIDKDYCYCEICTYDIERFRKKDGLKNRWHYYFDAWYWAPKYMFKSCVQKLKRKSKFILKRMLNR